MGWGRHTSHDTNDTHHKHPPYSYQYQTPSRTPIESVWYMSSSQWRVSFTLTQRFSEKRLVHRACNLFTYQPAVYIYHTWYYEAGTPIQNLIRISIHSKNSFQTGETLNSFIDFRLLTESLSIVLSPSPSNRASMFAGSVGVFGHGYGMHGWMSCDVGCGGAAISTWRLN